MMFDNTNSKKSTWQPWLIWFFAAGFFFCDYFARVSPGVMTSQLMGAFDMTALGLGGLSAFFYYPYLAMQIPVGLLVDRLNIRRLLTVMSIITALGCYLFGAADSFYMAAFGRFLIGFSASFAFVSALKLAATWFPPARLGLLAGLTQAMGMLGAAVGDEPVQYTVAAVGWRHTMYGMAIVFVLLSLMIFIVVRDGKQELKNTTSWASMWESLRIICTSKQSLINALFAGLIYAPTAAFAELWGVTYLQHVQLLSPSEAAWGNALIFIGWAVGGPIMGAVADRIGNRKRLMLFSALSGCVIFSIIILFRPLPAELIYVLMFLYGVTNTGLILAYVTATELHPPQHVGTSIAFTNMASVIIGAAMQPLIGELLDYFSKTHLHAGQGIFQATDFRMAIVILPLTSLLAAVTSFFIKGKRD